jgi:hypothetical protein
MNLAHFPHLAKQAVFAVRKSVSNFARITHNLASNWVFWRRTTGQRQPDRHPSCWKNARKAAFLPTAQVFSAKPQFCTRPEKVKVLKPVGIFSDF